RRGRPRRRGPRKPRAAAGMCSRNPAGGGAASGNAPDEPPAGRGFEHRRRAGNKCHGRRCEMTHTTWQAHTKHGELTDRSDLPDSVFAFPKQRKEPLTDASHVRNALARFDQVEGVSDEDRDLAFANIKKAAEHYQVEMEETDWRQLGRKPHTANSAQ